MVPLRTILMKTNRKQYLQKDSTELVFLILKIDTWFCITKSDQSIIKKVMDSAIFNNTQIKSIQFETQDEIIKYNIDINNNNKLFGGIIFENKYLLKYSPFLVLKISIRTSYEFYRIINSKKTGIN
ncbi:hypothetical protein U3516DRAFT_745543 [Neocallimastix sp. 'constans']